MTGALLAILLATALPDGAALAIDPEASKLMYHIVHKLHRVDAESKQVEGKAVVQQGGKVLAMVRAPVSSFRSGDGNRDAHMGETLEVGKYPHVVFKGVVQLGPGGALPSGPLSMQGEVELHGVQRPVTVPLTVEPGPAGVRVRGSFQVSLESFRIERPSLLFVKIDDACRIDLDLLLREEKR